MIECCSSVLFIWKQQLRSSIGSPTITDVVGWWQRYTPPIVITKGTHSIYKGILLQQGFITRDELNPTAPCSRQWEKLQVILLTQQR
jgi:hypothetical protein